MAFVRLNKRHVMLCYIIIFFEGCVSFNKISLYLRIVFDTVSISDEQ